MRTKTGIALMAAVAFAAIPAGEAAAADGVVGVSAGTLRFQGAAGATNDIDILRSGGNTPFFHVFDSSPFVTATGCIDRTPPNPLAAECGSGPVVRILVLAGDGNDKATLMPPANTGKDASGNPVFVPTTLPAKLNGGLGDDSLTAGNGPDTIVGGPGANSARGMGGNDRLLMRNGVKDSLIDCGDGTDTAILDKVDPRPFACETVLRPR